MVFSVFAVQKSAWDPHVLSTSWCSVQGGPSKHTQSFAEASCLQACFATFNLPAPNVLLSLSYSSLLFLIVSSDPEEAPGLWAWCNEFLSFRGAFSCNHSWSKWFISVALLCALVFRAWLKRAKFSPQLEMENSQMPLMNFKLLLFLASVAARENLVIKLNNSY